MQMQISGIVYCLVVREIVYKLIPISLKWVIRKGIRKGNRQRIALL